MYASFAFSISLNKLDSRIKHIWPGAPVNLLAVSHLISLEDRAARHFFRPPCVTTVTGMAFPSVGENGFIKTSLDAWGDVDVPHLYLQTPQIVTRITIKLRELAPTCGTKWKCHHYSQADHKPGHK